MPYYSANSCPPPDGVAVLGFEKGDSNEQRLVYENKMWCHAGGLTRPFHPITTWRPAPGTKLEMELRDKNGIDAIEYLQKLRA